MRDKYQYWQNKKLELMTTMELLKNIKREMNIQPPKKVIDKYIKQVQEDLDEAKEAQMASLD